MATEVQFNTERERDGKGGWRFEDARGIRVFARSVERERERERLNLGFYRNEESEIETWRRL